jgi:hypothetical protein
MFENRMLMAIVESRRQEVTAGGENYIMRSLIIYTLHQIFLG